MPAVSLPVQELLATVSMVRRLPMVAGHLARREDYAMNLLTAVLFGFSVRRAAGSPPKVLVTTSETTEA